MTFLGDEAPPCREPMPLTRVGSVEVDVSLVRANVVTGKVASYSFRPGGPSDTQASAAATRYLDDGRGGITQNATLPSHGSLTINVVSIDRIEGTLVAEDSRNGLNVRGAFSIAICPPATAR